MKIVLLFTFLLLSLYGDFTLIYKLDSNITQKVDYKDDQHILFTILNNNNISEKLVILNDKKYIIFYENGIQHIYEISDELSEPVKESNNTIQYKIVKKLGNSKFGNFNVEKWRVKYADGAKSTDILVSKDKKLYNSIFKVIAALKKLLPADKQQQADIFNMGHGYVLLETGDLKLLSYKENKLSNKLFAITDELSDDDEKKFSQNIDNCFTNVCCNKKSIEPTQIKFYLNNNIKNWKLEKMAKCTDPSEKNIESAIYSDKSNKIIVEMTTGEETSSGKIASLIEQGIKVENYKVKDLLGYKTVSAYLPIIDATITDVILPNTTISIYSKGKKKLYNFAQKALKLRIKNSFSSNDY